MSTMFGNQARLQQMYATQPRISRNTTDLYTPWSFCSKHAHKYVRDQTADMRYGKSVRLYVESVIKIFTKSTYKRKITDQRRDLLSDDRMRIPVKNLRDFPFMTLKETMKKGKSVLVLDDVEYKRLKSEGPDLGDVVLRWTNKMFTEVSQTVRELFTKIKECYLKENYMQEVGDEATYKRNWKFSQKNLKCWANQVMVDRSVDTIKYFSTKCKINKCKETPHDRQNRLGRIQRVLCTEYIQVEFKASAQDPSMQYGANFPRHVTDNISAGQLGPWVNLSKVLGFQEQYGELAKRTDYIEKNFKSLLNNIDKTVQYKILDSTASYVSVNHAQAKNIITMSGAAFGRPFQLPKFPSATLVSRMPWEHTAKLMAGEMTVKAYFQKVDDEMMGKIGTLNATKVFPNFPEAALNLTCCMGLQYSPLNYTALLIENPLKLHKDDWGSGHFRPSYPRVKDVWPSNENETQRGGGSKVKQLCGPTPGLPMFSSLETGDAKYGALVNYQTEDENIRNRGHKERYQMIKEMKQKAMSEGWVVKMDDGSFQLLKMPKELEFIKQDDDGPQKAIPVSLAEVPMDEDGEGGGSGEAHGSGVDPPKDRGGVPIIGGAKLTGDTAFEFMIGLEGMYKYMKNDGAINHTTTNYGVDVANGTIVVLHDGVLPRPNDEATDEEWAAMVDAIKSFSQANKAAILGFKGLDTDKIGWMAPPLVGFLLELTLKSRQGNAKAHTAVGKMMTAKTGRQLKNAYKELE